MPASKCGGILGISASGTAPSKLAAIRWSYGSRPAWCSRGSQTPGTRQPAGLQAARPFCSRSDLEERGACGPPRPDPQPSGTVLDSQGPGARPRTDPELRPRGGRWGSGGVDGGRGRGRKDNGDLGASPEA